MYVCMCVLVYADYYVIACNYVLGGTLGALRTSGHLLSNEIFKKQGKGTVYRHRVQLQAFVNHSVIADKNNNNAAHF